MLVNSYLCVSDLCYYKMTNESIGIYFSVLQAVLKDIGVIITNCVIDRIRSRLQEVQ